MPSTTTIHFVLLPRLVFPTPAFLFSREQNSRPETTRSTSTAGAGLTRSETREDYGINNVIGDQYYCDVIRKQLLHLGINYEISVFGPNTRARIFANFKHLLVQGKIELLGNAELLLQLRNLREEKTDRGQIDVRPGGGTKDDLAVAVALAASELSKRPSPPGPFLMPTGELQLLRNPMSCSLQAICQNFPCCMDEGVCQNFVDQRLTGQLAYRPRGQS